MSLKVSSTSSLVDHQEFLEFSDTCRLPYDALSPFLDLHDLDNLSYVSKHFKAHFLETGRREAFRMHKVGLCSLLLIDKISKNLGAWYMPAPAGIHSTATYYHQRAVEDSYCVLFNFKDIPQTRIFPIPLYRRLIKYTADAVFFSFCHRFHFSKLFINANRIKLFFSIYSQLRQAKICMPELWALATRASIEPPNSGGISKLIRRIGLEFSLDSSRVDEQVECVIKITEQNPCAKLRGNTQIELATLFIRQEKMEIAQKLLASVQDCESRYNHSYGQAVIAVFKHSVSDAAPYLKRSFLTDDEQTFYQRQITYILKPKPSPKG
jgi:hypothetical protein